MKTISWNIQHFNKLTTLTFHNIISLREKVFVVEQDRVYLDVDGKDVYSHHVYGQDSNGNVVATCRILEPNNENIMFIGRVVCCIKHRGSGFGNKAMNKALDFIKEKYPDSRVQISAQTYLMKFYTTLGFVAYGEEYLEDNIPQFAMYLECN